MDRVYAMRRSFVARLLRLLKFTNSATSSNYSRYCRPWLLRQSPSFQVSKFPKTSIAGSDNPSAEVQTHFGHHVAFRRRPEKTRHIKQYRKLREEFKALSVLLVRPNILSSKDVNRILYPDYARGYSTGPQQNQPDDEDKEKEDKDKEDEERLPLLPRLLFWFWLLFALYTALRLLQGEDTAMYRFISWNEFYHDMLAKGEVDEIIVRPEMEMAMINLYPGAVIKGKKVDVTSYSMKIPDPYKFEERVRKAEAELGIRPEQGVSVSYQRESSWAPLVFLGLIGLATFLLLRTLTKSMTFPNPTEMFANERKAKFTRVDVLTQQGKGVSFKDVAGLQEAKQEIMEFVDYLKQPQRFKEIGAKLPHGALLLGPPGCGKTLLARAVASEAKVPFLAMAGSEFVEMLGGLGAARVRDLFKEARKRAPCIVYIDEIDAIGRKRSGSTFGASAEEEHTLNQMLVEMDGMGTSDGVILLAATNRADILDKALLRPGRFDRHITIDLPTLAERKEIFEMYLSRLKLSQPASTYSLKLAQMTPGMSGADIANICNEAAIFAARDKKKVIEAEDFDHATERVIAGVAKKTRLLSPQEKKVVAYHESGHALVGWLLKHTDALLKISIVPRTNSALGFAQYMPADQKLYNTEELFERMCMALGGRAAEAIVFNHITTGAQDDLKKVTQMAYDQIRSYGMNERIGCLSFPSEADSNVGTKPYSKSLAAVIDEEANRLVTKAYRHTEQVLAQHKDKLNMLAMKLLERETLTYDDVKALIGPPPHGEKHTIVPAGWLGEPLEDNNNIDNDATMTRSQRRRRNREELPD
ncbi:paraplegin-like [Liolophura sinensis]|uniref:paraplegin-like n=1 Tax=Liolophura sinensis TaxID=3198878 RepID=UPI003157F338